MEQKHKPGVEIWKPILELDSFYEASSLGRVKRLKRFVDNNGGKYMLSELILKQKVSQKGYLNISISFKSKKHTFRVHRLIAKSFISNPNNLSQVNHINGIKDDNRVENLEWCTNQENCIHAFKIGLRESPMKGKFGKYHNRSVAVVQKRKKGKFIKKFNSITEASAETFVNKGNIQSACCGRYNSAGGFKWSYYE